MEAPTLTEVAPRESVVAGSRAVLARHARTFRWASHLLGAGQQDEAAVVFALCRLVDDIADETPDDATARADLAALADELAGKAAPRPLVDAYLDVAARRGFGVQPALHLLEGVLGDRGRVRVEDDDELARYCYRVAGTVGLMMCGVIGVTDQRALPHAVDLGIGMQLTNICRDVLEDAGRDRVYLPASRLRRQGVTPDDLPRGSASRAAVAAVVRDLLALADRYYDSADRGMRFIPWRPRLAIMVASRVYRAIGIRLLRKADGDPMGGRTWVPTPGKLAWTLRALASTALLTLLAPFTRPTHETVLHRPLTGLPGTHAQRALP